MIYEIGDLARISVLFTDILNNPENPTTVTLVVLAPDGTSSTITSGIINPSTGNFYYDFPVAQSGIYKFQYTGVGSVQAVQEGQFIVAGTTLVKVPAIDLTTLQQVKSYLNLCDSTSDSIISWAITSASVYWLWRTGRINSDGSVPTKSPFVQPLPYNEWYDGNGNDRLFLRQSPIVSVQALMVNGTLIQQSLAWGQTGFVIDQNGRSLTFRSAGGGGRAGAYTYYAYSLAGFATCFPIGTQNINVQYTAGYSAIPPDVNEAVTEMVGLTVKRRGWIDQKQNAQPETIGTVTYRDWEYTPKIRSVMEFYSRRAAN